MPPGSTTAQARVEAMVEAFVARGVFGAASVALIVDQDTTYLAFGNRSRTDPRPPDERSFYEIGSITKVFTGLLLARMVEDGQVALDDPVAALLPPGTVVPTREEVAITLGHLTTHTSGLPRLADNMPAGDPRDPYADYTVRHLYAFLAGHALASRPGASVTYSNVGVGLLGHALGRRDGRAWVGAIRAKVLDPLGLVDTTPTLSAEQRARAVAGLGPAGAEVPTWTFTDASAGAGALRSTARDLARWLRAELRPASSPLSASLARTQEPLVQGDDGRQVGHGWFLFDEGQVLFHNGGTGGFRAFVGAVPTEGRAVVLLASTTDPVTDAVGLAALAMLRGDPTRGPRPGP